MPEIVERAVGDLVPYVRDPRKSDAVVDQMAASIREFGFKELGAVGLVSKVDRAAIAAYCEAYGRWAEAASKLHERGLLVKAPSG
jgi:phage terminase small subunit